MAKAKPLLLANGAQPLLPGSGRANVTCGAVEAIDRMVVALFGEVTLTWAGFTAQVGGSRGLPCPLYVTVHERMTDPENPVAGVTFIARFFPPPGVAIVSASAVGSKLKGATTAKARVPVAACPFTTEILTLLAVPIKLAGTVAISWVALRKVVASEDPFHCTVEPLWKFVPLTVRVKA